MRFLSKLQQTCLVYLFSLMKIHGLFGSPLRLLFPNPLRFKTISTKGLLSDPNSPKNN
jgi:hypothetical protein